VTEEEASLRVLETSQHGEPNFQRGDVCYEQKEIHKNFNENMKNNLHSVIEISLMASAG
jgi:hypothetical protein